MGVSDFCAPHVYLSRLTLTNNDQFRRRKYPLDAWAWFLQGEGFKAQDMNDGGDIVKAASCFQIAKKLVRSCIDTVRFFHVLTFQLMVIAGP